MNFNNKKLSFTPSVKWCSVLGKRLGLDRDREPCGQPGGHSRVWFESLRPGSGCVAVHKEVIHDNPTNMLDYGQGNLRVFKLFLFTFSYGTLIKRFKLKTATWCNTVSVWRTDERIGIMREWWGGEEKKDWNYTWRNGCTVGSTLHHLNGLKCWAEKQIEL